MGEFTSTNMQDELERLRRENKDLREDNMRDALLEENSHLRAQLQSMSFRGKPGKPMPPGRGGAAGEHAHAAYPKPVGSPSVKAGTKEGANGEVRLAIMTARTAELAAEVAMSPSISFKAEDSTAEEAKRADRILADHYDYDAGGASSAVLGKGSFGVVKRGLAKASTGGVDAGTAVAIKSVDKYKMGSSEEEMINNEIKIMWLVHGSVNVVNLIDTFVDDSFVYIVLELCEGGELFERIIKRGTLSEKIAQVQIRKMLQTIAHVHSSGVCHRDLKPENFLFADDSDEAEIKLTDFGLSCFCGVRDTLTSAGVGTLYYMAPEVITASKRKPYGAKCDVWGLGVILYCMLTGALPFVEDDDEITIYQIRHQEVDLVSVG